MIEKRKATESSKKSSIIKYKEKFKELKIVTLDNDDNAKKWKSMKEKIKNGSKLDRARWMCNLCGKEDYNKFTMKRHIKTHSQGHKHKCQVCSYCFKNIESLNFHWFIFHANGKNNWKEEEDESEPSETNIDDVPWTKRKKGYTCDICGHYSDAISKIVRHTNTHTNTHSKKCGFCSFNFMNSESLTNHISLLHSNHEFEENVKVRVKVHDLEKSVSTHKDSGELENRKSEANAEDSKLNANEPTNDNENMSLAKDAEDEGQKMDDSSRGDGILEDSVLDDEIVEMLDEIDEKLDDNLLNDKSLDESKKTNVQFPNDQCDKAEWNEYLLRQLKSRNVLSFPV